VSGLARGNDSPHAALDPGESSSPPAGRANRCAREEFAIFLCVAGSVWTGVFRKAISHMLYARRERRFETQRPDCRIRTGNARECRGVRAFVDEAPRSAREFRARYRETAAATAQSEKENAP